LLKQLLKLPGLVRLHQLVARDHQIDIFEVVLARTANGDDPLVGSGFAGTVKQLVNGRHSASLFVKSCHRGETVSATVTFR
jgi:hypothetical protein